MARGTENKRMTQIISELIISCPNTIKEMGLSLENLKNR